MNRVRNVFIIIGILIVSVCLALIIKVLFKEPEPVKDVSFEVYSGEVTKITDVAQKDGAVIVFFDPEIEGSVKVVDKLIKNKKDCAVIAVSVSKKTADEQLEKLDDDIKALKYLVFESKDFIKAYNIGNPPVTYFVDKKLLVQDAFVGDIKEKTIKKCFEKIS